MCEYNNINKNNFSCFYTCFFPKHVKYSLEMSKKLSQIFNSSNDQHMIKSNKSRITVCKYWNAIKDGAKDIHTLY
ncbi:uncharacterized protein [Prorops nasuta]|uniref:uncharacterized protein isoform X2 n=1 Tax=Prorops nasuta TaxID=863751 RepID=UPI0034CD6F1E